MGEVSERCECEACGGISPYDQAMFCEAYTFATYLTEIVSDALDVEDVDRHPVAIALKDLMLECARGMKISEEDLREAEADEKSWSADRPGFKRLQKEYVRHLEYLTDEYDVAAGRTAAWLLQAVAKLVTSPYMARISTRSRKILGLTA